MTGQHDVQSCLQSFELEREAQDSVARIVATECTHIFPQLASINISCSGDKGDKVNFMVLF
jgi:hypothetical protein